LVIRDFRRIVRHPAARARKESTRAANIARDLAGEVALGRSQLRARNRLVHAGARQGEVIVGPWLSEVGFEVLYWIPTLHMLADRQRLAPERTTVISRGGAEPWYAGLADRYIDLFDLFTPAELRSWHDRRVREAGGQKHMQVTAFDQEVLRRAGDRLPAGAELVHPSSMYNAFQYYWRWRTPPVKMLKQLHFRRIPEPGPDPRLDSELPDDYVAVKAYFSSCFPPTEENRRFLRDLVERLSAQSEVVLLSTGLKIDDHEELTLDLDRVVDLSRLMTPRDNLAVQTRVISRARALVTTYGGFSYLGPFLGVPSVCFYSHDNFNSTHFELMRHVLRELDGSRFLALDTRDIGLLDGVLGSPLAQVRQG
jgi:hypothetical protein